MRKSPPDVITISMPLPPEIGWIVSVLEFDPVKILLAVNVLLDASLATPESDVPEPLKDAAVTVPAVVNEAAAISPALLTLARTVLVELFQSWRCTDCMVAPLTVKGTLPEA